MSEWWTYTLSDFLMFSPQIYWRLVERYNRDAWPLQLAALAAGCGLLWLAIARRPRAARVAAVVLGAAWLWTGWSFHWQRYATINWAAQYLAFACGAQAVLLLAAAAMGRAPRPCNAIARRMGLAIAALGVLLYPLLGLAFGRPLAQAEVFGLMPDPTALATIGMLLALPMPYRAWLALIPVLSFSAGMLTLWAMAL